MFNINEPLYFWIPSQVFALAALFFIVWAFQSKTRFLVLQTLHFALMVVSLLLLQNWVVAGILAIAIVRNLAFNYYARQPHRDWRTAKITSMIVFMMATISLVATVAIVDGHWWMDWVMLGFGLAFIVAIWMGGIHPIRIVSFVYAPFIIYNYVHYQNFVGIIIDVFAAIAIIVFYARLLAKAKARENLVDDGLGNVGAADLTDVSAGGGDIDGDEIQM